MAFEFVEGDRKVTPNLTLNLGLRYDFATPPYEGAIEMANFNPAAAGSLQFAPGGSLGNRSLVSPARRISGRVSLSLRSESCWSALAAKTSWLRILPSW
jgi:outer membrane receptor protein involved in Fe transport